MIERAPETTELPKSFGQVRLPLLASRERDRNFSQGGRSFYFFDFDDNIVHLQTKILVFHRRTSEERSVATGDFPKVSKELGRAGTEWEHFEIREDCPTTGGSYRNFREIAASKLGGRPQPLVEDMLQALQNPFVEWRGPSWDFFAHAVNNNRPIAVVTARGHHPHTIRRAIDLLVLSRDLDSHPNYLSIYPVSQPETRHMLGDREMKLGTAQLKKLAIIQTVRDAFACYGENPFHRFGMSDDDPHNVQLIVEAMRELKREYRDNAFFAFNTWGGKIVREEILIEGTERTDMGSIHKVEQEQMTLF